MDLGDEAKTRVTPSAARDLAKTHSLSKKIMRDVRDGVHICESFAVFAVQDDRTLSGSSFLVENLHCRPRFIGRRLFVFERAIQIHFGQQVVRIKFEES